MSFLKRSLVVILSYVAASFVAGVAWIFLALVLRGPAIVYGYGPFDLVTLTAFIALFAGLASLAVIILAEWLRIGSLAYYGAGGLAAAMFTVGYFAYGAFDPQDAADYALYAAAGALGGIAFWMLAARAKPVMRTGAA
ncbi:hypothetical protein [Sphingobium aquiterrae]|uniref:hypothetical protein n=1 Tax=Sphingobium aquiterrae TaxID=2038656 RepID=UPI00301AC917